MGVPKFFRWLSERYPKINQRFGSLPSNETCERYFGKPPPPPLEAPDPLSTCGLAPPVDRLYLDMNGIIHGCSHNNSTDEDGAEINSSTTTKITQKEIFQNVCYYLDRIVGDIVQPNEMVYMAIDGVAPRAKLNQQRSRRYRSGLEGQIETTIYQAHAQKMAQEEEQRLAEERNLLTGDSLEMEATPFSMDDGFSFVYPPDSMGVSSQSTTDSTRLEEVTPGRFKGKFKASASDDAVIGDEDDGSVFHSNVITPGTPFFQEFTRHLEHFVKYKISTDPKWRRLTIVFSGPNVPGEGEHKIMDFIRAEKKRPGYNPNLRHCIMGQDGDLIMLGLATHEPNMVLLRERVIFNMTKQRMAVAHFGGLDSYLHNAHFEFLHMGVLRDYLAFEFETSNVLSTSVVDLEHTIDDFVFMTFFVGNDFLPHMPALDIGDHAFDLLFHAYKYCRKKWIEQGETMPYLTNRGNIISGRRLEEFLAVLGSHEVTYYDKKRQAAPTEAKRIQRIYKKFGMELNVPDANLVASKEESDRAAYREMLVKQQMHRMSETNDIGPDSRVSHDSSDAMAKASFRPVMTGTFQPQEDTKEMDDSLASLLGNLLQNSLSGNQEGVSSTSLGIDDQDLKGRYYYDKFQFTPFDKEKHLALRKAYIEGLVWNLKYYYEGCVSWEWFFPYHYGPMISDLVNLDEILKEVSFEGRLGFPLKPFEQLMGCMPPSQSRHLPKPYRRFMTDPNSPIIDFYPESFVIDMNGKRWPWEAVTLLPFIDSRRLLEASATVHESELTEDEKIRNSFGDAVIFSHDPHHSETLPAIGDTEGLQTIDQCAVMALHPHASTVVFCPAEKPVLEPQLAPGVEIPLPGYGSLRNAPIQSLWRRKIGIDVFSSRSRYITSCLEISNLMPPLPPIEDLAPKLIGSSVYINYPYFLEGFVTAVSNEVMTIRGECKPRLWSASEAEAWRNIRDGVARQFLTGEGVSGSGGMMIPDDQPITLSIRPFEKIVMTKYGQLAKSYAKFEIEVPLIATFWEPKSADPRLNLPSKLEKNRFEIAAAGSQKIDATKAGVSTQQTFPKRLFPAKQPSLTNIQTASLSTRAQNGEARRYFSNSTSLGLRSDLKVHMVDTTAYPVKSEFFWQSGRRLIPGPRKDWRTNLRSTPSTRGRVLVGAFMAFGVLAGVVQGVSVIEHRNLGKGHIKNLLTMAPHDVIESSVSGGLLLNCRGGNLDGHDSWKSKPPPLEFAHGTTTLSFVFQGGIIAAVDSRASLGSFVGSKTTQKVLPVNSHILGTMAGGAADCMYWIRNLKSRALLHELAEGSRMTVARASRLLSNALYERRGSDLSLGTMIMGYDEEGPPRIFYLDNTGKRIEGQMFAVGSGSTFALAILDTDFRHDLSIDEAIALGIKAIRHATFRDAYSGGFINVYIVTKEGWKKVYTEDIARFATDHRSKSSS